MNNKTLEEIKRLLLLMDMLDDEGYLYKKIAESKSKQKTKDFGEFLYKVAEINNNDLIKFRYKLSWLKEATFKIGTEIDKWNREDNEDR